VVKNSPAGIPTNAAGFGQITATNIGFTPRVMQFCAEIALLIQGKEADERSDIFFYSLLMPAERAAVLPSSRWVQMIADDSF